MIRYEGSQKDGGVQTYQCEARFDPTAFRKIEYVLVGTAHSVYISLDPPPRATGFYHQLIINEELKTIMILFDNQETAQQFINLWNSAF